MYCHNKHGYYERLTIRVAPVISINIHKYLKATVLTYNFMWTFQLFEAVYITVHVVVRNDQKYISRVYYQFFIIRNG